MAETGGDRDEEFTFRKLFRDLNLHVDVGVRYYKAQRTVMDATFYAMYVELKDQLTYAQKNEEFVLQEAPKYDFVYPDGKRVKGNGFRSLLHVFMCCAKPMLKHLQACSKDRGGILTTAGDHYKTLQPYITAFKGIALGLDGAACLIKVCVCVCVRACAQKVCVCVRSMRLCVYVCARIHVCVHTHVYVLCVHVCAVSCVRCACF